MTSKSGGKVKIINVTEARANFATVLSDGASSYVITKNNKPQRVIINYLEYEHLQQAVPSVHLLRGQDTSQEGVNEVEPAEGGDAAALEIEKTAVEKTTKRGTAKEKTSKGSSVKGLLKERMEQAQQGADYFGGSEDTYGLEEAVEILNEPEVLDDEEFKQVKQSLLEESGDDDLSFEDLSDETGEQEQTAPQENNDKTDFVQTLKNRHHSPEEEEYFQKYHKLYESQLPAEENNTEVVVEVAKAVKTRAPVEAKTTSVDTKNTTPDKSAPDDNLPSLEDLLRGLNIDPLGDDNDNLDEKEINDLISRITND